MSSAEIRYINRSPVGIILIHGAGLGSFIWQPMKKMLQYPSLAIDFPNRGSDKKINAALTLSDYTANAIAQVEHFNSEKFIIAAHSIGGCIGLQLAEHYKERVIGFAAISAAIPQHGGSYLSCFPFMKRTMLNLLMRIAGTQAPAKTIEAQLCNGLSIEQAKKIIKNFTPESRLLYTDDCQAPIPSCKTIYVKCRKDRALPVSLQDKMAGNLHTKNLESFDSGHLPMLRVPAELAATLNNFTTTC